MKKELTPKEIIFCTSCENTMKKLNDDVSSKKYIGFDKIKKALNIKKDGFNIYYVDSFSKEKVEILAEQISEIYKEKEAPKDICYVTNQDSTSPKIIFLKNGKGVLLKDLLEEVKKKYLYDINEFYSSSSIEEKESIIENINEERNNYITKLMQMAKVENFDVKSTSGGFIFIPLKDGGNEMTQVLEEFSELIDPKSNRPLTDRTVLIANTSNMPVAAREASIYTGLTLAEYYRDMGYHVAIMADSTSRWAEALREISGRLEEMPAEEGFPAYLPSRISQFYERAGYMETLNHQNGSVTIIGAVSPQGSDFSEPVTQNTKRFVRCFWALDKALAYARHYFAINWNESYSEYVTDLSKWYNKNVHERFLRNRQQIMSLLAEETKLMEIVKLIGSDVLPEDQKLVIEICKVIRVGYLQQNAFHAEDTYVPLEKQLRMMDIILYLYKKSKELVATGKPISEVAAQGIFEKVTKMKYDVPNDHIEMFDDYYAMIDEAIAKVA